MPTKLSHEQIEEMIISAFDWATSPAHEKGNELNALKIMQFDRHFQTKNRLIDAMVALEINDPSGFVSALNVIYMDFDATQVAKHTKTLKELVDPQRADAVRERKIEHLFPMP